MPGTQAFNISLPAAMTSLEEARLALITWLEPFALEARVINRVEVVLEELVTNVVRHAEGAGRVSVAAECAGEAVKLAVEDDGPAFNPLEAAAPAPFAGLDEAQIGGQGIPLIKRLSRSVSYDRAGSLNRVSAVIG